MTISKTVFFFLLFSNLLAAQKQGLLKGSFSQAAMKEIQIKGFSLAGDSLLVKTTADAQGNFKLSYPASYTGAALLEIKDSKSIILLLNQENFEMQWTNLEDFKTLNYENSPENQAFSTGMVVAQQSASVLSALNYLKPIYEGDPKVSKSKIDWINTEVAYQQKAFPDFLKSLARNSYAGYYLSLRKFLQDLPQVAGAAGHSLTAKEEQFKNLDFTRENLLHSGLYAQLLDTYFIMIEENYGTLDQVYLHINASVDAILKSADKNPSLKQELAQHLFLLFEKRSLFAAAEHLALAMLNAENCQMDGKQHALFEQYRKMAKGQIAPDIDFAKPVNGIQKLSEIKAKYKLIVFGASWCDKCQKDLPKLIPFYENWKSKEGLEVVFVSLDQDQESYIKFSKDFPWISSCDFKGWETKAAVDYCVFASPTMYLLDAQNTILLKPVSPEQIQAWLETRRGSE